MYRRRCLSPFLFTCNDWNLSLSSSPPTSTQVPESSSALNCHSMHKTIVPLEEHLVHFSLRLCTMRNLNQTFRGLHSLSGRKALPMMVQITEVECPSPPRRYKLPTLWLLFAEAFQLYKHSQMLNYLSRIPTAALRFVLPTFSI